MKQMFIAFLVATLTFGGTLALADDTTLINEMTMKPLTPEQSAKLRAERDAANAQWAKMTPDEKAAVKKSAQQKRQGDLSAMERIGQNDDMSEMTKSETAPAKNDREAAEAKWAKMTPDEKNAARKAAQQKRQSEMNAIERAGQRDDVGRYLSY